MGKKVAASYIQKYEVEKKNRLPVTEIKRTEKSFLQLVNKHHRNISLNHQPAFGFCNYIIYTNTRGKFS